MTKIMPERLQGKAQRRNGAKAQRHKGTMVSGQDKKKSKPCRLKPVACCPHLFILAHVSFNDTVRLKTGCDSVES